MKKLYYLLPELQLHEVAIERGFAQTSNIEDPITKPEQDW